MMLKNKWNYNINYQLIMIELTYQQLEQIKTLLLLQYHIKQLTTNSLLILIILAIRLKQYKLKSRKVKLKKLIVVS